MAEDKKAETKDKPTSPAEGNPAGDPLDESPVKPDKGVEKAPKADENANEDAGVNSMRTEGLSPAQVARINGTVLDGANGANVTGGPAYRPLPGEDE